MHRFRLIVMLGSWLVSGVAAQSQSFTLDLAATPTGSELALTVSDHATISINILRTGDLTKPSTVDLDLTSFINEQGRTADFKISLPGKENERTAHLPGVLFDTPIKTVNLHVPELPPGGKSSGRLILTQRTLDGQPATAAPIAWRFAVTSVKETRPATLVVSPQGTLTLPVVRGWCFIWCLTSDDVPKLLLSLSDKSGNWPIEGVTVRPAQGLKVPGSNANMRDFVSAEFNGTTANLFSEPAAGQRNIGARGQAAVTLSFRNLSAGEYVIPLQFAAKNSTDDASQRMTVTLQVRESALWAILVLILAALLSFIATRVVTALRQRALFLEKVRTMRPFWLGSEPPSLAVIWFRAALRQAEDLSDRYWLTGQSELDAKLTAAESMLTVLTRVRDVRQRIAAIIDPAVRRRAQWKLDDIVKSIPATKLIEADVTNIRGALDKLDGWCDANKVEAEYWADLLPQIASRLREVDLAAFSSPDHKTIVESWIKALQTTPSNLAEKIQLEKTYQRLTIMWQLRQDAAALAKLVALKDDPEIEKVFAAVDDLNWKALTAPATQLQINAPTGEPVEAYEPVVFKLNVVGDKALEGSFLVQKKLTYNWTIEVSDPRDGSTLQTLQVESKQPRIAQFFPRASTMKATVQIDYEGKAGPKVEQAIGTPVSNSSTFRAWRIVEASDWWAFGIVLFLSVVSGLSGTLFGVTFGASLKDYLALFAWGASLDQGKNFIQALAAYKR
jgi:hypothetical protein